MSDDAPKPPPQKKPFQFRLVTLLAVMGLSSVFAWLLGGLIRSGEDSSDFKSRLVLLTLVAPIGLIVVIAVVRFLTGPKTKKKKKPW